MSKGRIKEINYESARPLIGIKQGVKKSQQPKFENDSRYKGGRGTYSSIIDSIPSGIIFTVKAYDLDQDIHVDLKSEILSHNNMGRVSPPLINYIKEKNEGRKVRVVKVDGEYTIALDDIDIDYR